MEIKEAVKAALRHVQEIFAGEKLSDVGLEEVRFDEAGQAWEVTIGFSRPWDYPAPTAFAPFAERLPKREYKVARVKDSTGSVESVLIREVK